MYTVSKAPTPGWQEAMKACHTDNCRWWCVYPLEYLFISVKTGMNPPGLHSYKYNSNVRTPSPPSSSVKGASKPAASQGPFAPHGHTSTVSLHAANPHLAVACFSALALCLRTVVAALAAGHKGHREASLSEGVQLFWRYLRQNPADPVPQVADQPVLEGLATQVWQWATTGSLVLSTPDALLATLRGQPDWGAWEEPMYTIGAA